MLRNGETGDWIGTFQGHKGAVWACVLNDPAMIAATASADFTARVWNAITGDELHQFQHKHIVRTAAFAHGPTAPQLVTGGPEKLLRIFDLGQPSSAPVEIAGAPDSIRCAAWIDNNNSLVVSYLDKPGLDIWDIRSGSVVNSLEAPTAVTSVEITSNGKLVTADGSGVDIRDLETLALIRRIPISDYEVESATFCEEKERVVAGGKDMWVHVYDSISGEEIECCRGHHGPVHCVRFAPGGATFSSGSEDGTIRIWQTDAPQV